MSHKWTCKVIFYLLLLTPVLGYADAVPPRPSISDVRNAIPSSVNAGVIGNILQGSVVPKFSRKPSAIQQQAPPPKPAEAAEAKILFKLMNVTFQGNTVFSSQELRQIFQPFINQTISLLKLRDLVGDVTKKYRDAGYILSRALLPPQTIKGGSVKIQIVEGFINQVTVKGDPGIARSLIQSYGNDIAKMKPLQFRQLERDMLLINDLPGITTKAVITPSKNVPGAADLALLVDRRKVSAYASYDNYGTRYLGPQEFGAGANFNSLMFPGDSLGLRLVTVAQTNQMQFYEIDEMVPIGANGTKLSLGGNYSQTKPGFNLDDLEVIGRSQALYADLSHPVIRSRSKDILLHAGLNYQNVSSTILGVPFYADRIRSLIIGGKWDGIDSWRGYNNFGLDTEHGFQILAANYKPLNQSRPKGLPNFTKISANISRLQGLGTRFSLLGAVKGQYSFNPLLAVEQFAYGGPDFGRGYDPAEIIGDDGLAGKLELRMDTAPGYRLLQLVQYYVFYDGGVVWNRDSINLLGRQDAFSAGFGARFTFMSNLTGNFFLAKPLTMPVATTEQMGQNGNRFRAFFQIVANI